MISFGSNFEDFKLKLFANLRSVLEGGPDVPENLLSEFRNAFDLSDDAGVAEIINALDLLEATEREMRLTREARLAEVEVE